jgi:RecA/RadA recombinase
MARHRTIVDLRALLAERFPAPPAIPQHLFITGLPFEPILGGGFPKGAITEVISPHLSAGSASLIAALIRSAHRDRYFVALIDGNDSFDPQPLGPDTLQNLLWLRCHNTVEAVKTADLLLRDGNFPLIVIDLVLNSARDVRKIPQTSWYRLQRLVEPTSSVFLVLTRFSTVSSAQLKILLENTWTLSSLANENAIASIRFRVQRSHGSSSALANAVAG